jgi:hypothetical protein
LAAGVDPISVSMEALLDPVAQATVSMEGPLRTALALSIANLFILSFVAALLGLISVLFTPRGRIQQLMQDRQPAESYPES